MKMKFVPSAALALSLAAALAFGGCASTPTQPQGSTVYNVSMNEAARVEYGSAEEMLADIRPTVVDVTSTSETGRSAGSGVIISRSEDEYFIITNHHVIDGGKTFSADVLTIAEDGTETTTMYEAQLIGSSMKRDIAVLSVRPPKGTELKTATFIDDSDTVNVGAEVFAIGNPLGILGGTVTHGIVSATKRDVAVSEIGTMTLMQTDTSINGGNSGGGLFASDGLLVGIINSGYDTYNGQNVEGLNFAIPANDAKYAASQLIETHREQNGAVTEYGYVPGDARIEIAFSTAALFTDLSLTAQANYLIGGAASEESPLYGTWGSSTKIVVAVTVNGKRTDLTVGGSSSYTLTALANETVAGIVAGDTVTIEYRNILGRSMGGFFGSTYYYADSAVNEISVTAEQYVYKP